MKSMHIIHNGTVIDHLPPGMGIRCFELLQKRNIGTEATIVFMNMPSSKCATKDMVKIQDFRLDKETATYLSMLAPSITINIIENGEIVKKVKPEIPDEVKGIVPCINSRCITNTEGYTSEFYVTSKNPVLLKCKYCEFEFKPE
jgi:aspartate carbamoyltransferase regulatory subunit